jgi:hypothetical protein
MIVQHRTVVGESQSRLDSILSDISTHEPDEVLLNYQREIFLEVSCNADL